MHRKKLFVTNQLLAVSWNGRIGESFVAMKRMKNWRTVGLGFPLTNGMAIAPEELFILSRASGEMIPTESVVWPGVFQFATLKKVGNVIFHGAILHDATDDDDVDIYTDWNNNK